MVGMHTYKTPGNMFHHIVSLERPIK